MAARGPGPAGAGWEKVYACAVPLPFSGWEAGDETGDGCTDVGVSIAKMWTYPSLMDFVSGFA